MTTLTAFQPEEWFGLHLDQFWTVLLLVIGVFLLPIIYVLVKLWTNGHDKNKSE